MRTQILTYLQEHFDIDMDQITDLWSRVEQDVSRFAKDRTLTEGDTEYLALAKWYVKALMGESATQRSPIIKTFKEFLMEKYNEEF